MIHNFNCTQTSRWQTFFFLRINTQSRFGHTSETHFNDMIILLSFANIGILASIDTRDTWGQEYKLQSNI